jgi:predicted amidophosphoribosyltransferase
MSSISLVTEFRDAMIDFIFPPTCSFCGKPLYRYSVLCDDCVRELNPSLQFFDKHSIKNNANDKEALIDRIVTCYNFSEVVQN